MLEIPDKAQRPAEVKAELFRRVDAGHQLILPTAAVIETGNHIHHLSRGDQRRSCAERFAALLHLSARGEAPWVLHDATWDAVLLERIRTGCSTGVALVDHATRGRRGGLGAGDLSILAERDLYRERRVDPRSVDVRVWSVDGLLGSFADV